MMKNISAVLYCLMFTVFGFFEEVAKMAATLRFYYIDI